MSLDLNLFVLWNLWRIDSLSNICCLQYKYTTYLLENCLFTLVVLILVVIKGHWFHFVAPKSIHSRTRSCLRTFNITCKGWHCWSKQGIDCWQALCNSTSDLIRMVVFQSCLCRSFSRNAQHWPTHLAGYEVDIGDGGERLSLNLATPKPQILKPGGAACRMVQKIFYWSEHENIYIREDMLPCEDAAIGG